MDLEFLMVPGGPPPAAHGRLQPRRAGGRSALRHGPARRRSATGALVEGGVTAQTRQVMANLKAVLAGAGTSLDRAVMVRVYLVNFGDYAEMNAEYASHFAPGRLPARTTVGVTGLALGGAVEIDLIVRLER
jgi:enamine deaminase RidA (YjgF/YER057c/UK114 family)